MAKKDAGKDVKKGSKTTKGSGAGAKDATAVSVKGKTKESLKGNAASMRVHDEALARRKEAKARTLKAKEEQVAKDAAEFDKITKGSSTTKDAKKTRPEAKTCGKYKGIKAVKGQKACGVDKKEDAYIVPDCSDRGVLLEPVPPIENKRFDYVDKIDAPKAKKTPKADTTCGLDKSLGKSLKKLDSHITVQLGIIAKAALSIGRMVEEFKKLRDGVATYSK